MKLKILFVSALLLVTTVPFGCSEDFPCLLYPVYAQTSTPSSSLKDVSLRDKIKALDAEIASRAAQLLPSISQRLQNKAYVGFVKSKTSNSLTLATKGGSFIVNVNDYTLYEGTTANKKLLTLTNLAEDDYLAALGDIDDTDVLTAKKIIRYPSPSKVEKQTIGGTVTAVTAQTITLRTFEGDMKTINLTAQTNYRFGDENADLTAVKTNKAIYAVSLSSENKLTARFVYIVPYTLTLPKTVAPTKSATPPASPASSTIPKKP